jgi:hypothetical protein
MKRVLLVLLVAATLFGGFLAVSVNLEERRLTETASAFLEATWEDALNPAAQALIHADRFMDFHSPEHLKQDVRTWRTYLGAYLGIGEHRGRRELGPNGYEVIFQARFENGLADAVFVFEQKRGAHGIVRFNVDLDPSTEMPVDETTALAAALTVGDTVLRARSTDLWGMMSFDLRSRIGSATTWTQHVTRTMEGLGDPGDPEEIEPFAFAKDDPSVFKGSWRTVHENGKLRVAIVLRWVDLSWRLDDIEFERTS